jgi:hypothetical protein
VKKNKFKFILLILKKFKILFCKKNKLKFCFFPAKEKKSKRLCKILKNSIYFLFKNVLLIKYNIGKTGKTVSVNNLYLFILLFYYIL